MTRSSATVIAVAAAIVALSLPAVAAAAPPPPTSLHVLDGEGWQADHSFSIGWTNPAADPPIAAVHYRVRNPEGEVESVPVRIGLAGAPTSKGSRWAARAPTRSRSGSRTPPVRRARPRTSSCASTRSDPAGWRRSQPDGWIGRTELPYAIRVTHPTGPQPVSGIRGYAISVDRAAATSPCLGSYLCTDAETDLRGGIADDALVVDELPEGTSYVHALAVSGSQVRSTAPGHTLIRVDRTDPVTTLSGLPGGLDQPLGRPRGDGHRLPVRDGPDRRRRSLHGDPGRRRAADRRARRLGERRPWSRPASTRSPTTRATRRAT